MHQDLVQAKSAITVVQHKRELSLLAECREREVRMEARLKECERRFWKELLRTSGLEDRTTSQSLVDGGRCSIAWAMNASRVLQTAREAHRVSTHDSQRQVARVIQSQVAVTAYENLRRKCAQRQKIKLREQEGEEVNEVASLTRARSEVQCNDLAAIGVESSNRNDGISWSCSLPRGGLDLFQRSMNQLGDALPRGEEYSRVPVRHSPIPYAEGVQVSSASFEASPQGDALHVTVESCGVPLACHITSPPTGELRVVLNVPHLSLLERLAGFRAMMRAKLHDAGLRVSNLDLDHTPSLGGMLARPCLRKNRAWGENNDNAIA